MCMVLVNKKIEEGFMVCGIGLDLCDINSIKNMSNKEGFIRKYLSIRESEYVEGKGKSADQTLAGMIAAKEAFVKMLGTGFENFDLAAIEVLHDSKGQPYFHLEKWAKKEVEKRFISRIFLSISHVRDIAGAYVVAEMTSDNIAPCREKLSEANKIEILANVIGSKTLTADMKLCDVPEYDYVTRKRVAVMLEGKFNVLYTDRQMQRLNKVSDIMLLMCYEPDIYDSDISAQQ